MGISRDGIFSPVHYSSVHPNRTITQSNGTGADALWTHSFGADGKSGSAQKTLMCITDRSERQWRFGRDHRALKAGGFGRTVNRGFCALALLERSAEHVARTDVVTDLAVTVTFTEVLL